MTSKRAGLVWVDAQGEKVLHVITTASGVGPIETALAAQSNAGVVECWEGLLEDYSPSTLVSIYPSTRMTAVLLFEDSIGSTARLYVPSPKSSLFNSSGDTVDPASASAIISAAIGNLRAGSGNTVTVFKGGYLSRAPVRALESTDVMAFVNPMSATGDLIYSTDNAGDAAPLHIGPAGDVLTSSGGIPTWLPAPGSGLLAHADARLASNVAMTTANVFYDGPSITPSAGTWWIISGLTVNSLAAAFLTGKLWDGTTAFDSAGADFGPNGDVQIVIASVQALSGTQVVRLSVAATAVSTTTIQAATRFNPAGNTASWIHAIKIA